MALTSTGPNSSDLPRPLHLIYNDFNVSLEAWLNEILNHPIAENWRDEVTRFVEQTERSGLDILPDSVRTIENAHRRHRPIRPVRPRSAHHRGERVGAAAGHERWSRGQWATGAGGGASPKMPASGERGALSRDEVRRRAMQISFNVQNQLGLTDAERWSLQAYYERVFSTGVAEPLPDFFQKSSPRESRRWPTVRNQPAPWRICAPIGSGGMPS